LNHQFILKIDGFLQFPFFLFFGILLQFSIVRFKGHCHEICCFWFFDESVSPQPQSIALGPFRIFSKIRGDNRKSRCTTGINDTGGKFATGVNDTGGKIAAGINDIGGKFATGVSDIGGKFFH
jgi:hypothetical protein